MSETMELAVVERPHGGGATVSPATLERVICDGDLSRLTPAQRVEWYIARCDASGLDWRTQPFRYLSLSGKLVLYADKTCSEQLRKIHGVSVVGLETQETSGVWIVTATVKDREGRTDVSTGAVPIKGLQGVDLANALMKTETKAKRRATLSICGLGMLDESEVDSIDGARRVDVATAHGQQVIEAEVVDDRREGPRKARGAARRRADGPEGRPEPEDAQEAAHRLGREMVNQMFPERSQDGNGNDAATPRAQARDGRSVAELVLDGVAHQRDRFLEAHPERGRCFAANEHSVARHLAKHARHEGWTDERPEGTSATLRLLESIHSGPHRKALRAELASYLRAQHDAAVARAAAEAEPGAADEPREPGSDG